ncbi:hypothetical protein HK100_007423 [Physocladia obscura]|uniref:Uncharacterized protein n=1 Tax=Physocladia obscura TaxID=109957 RepID=A0AAD5TAA7_9FUNG|nr:hypothetical protein HK100_007423 [Physocladia obscura]
MTSQISSRSVPALKDKPIDSNYSKNPPFVHYGGISDVQTFVQPMVIPWLIPHSHIPLINDLFQLPKGILHAKRGRLSSEVKTTSDEESTTAANVFAINKAEWIGEKEILCLLEIKDWVDNINNDDCDGGSNGYDEYQKRLRDFEALLLRKFGRENRTANQPNM